MYFYPHSAGYKFKSMEQKIVGRLDEQEVLKHLHVSVNAEFLAVTGRRRVGKTFLVKAFFNRKIDFELSGILNATYSRQLQNFQFCMNRHFPKSSKEPAPENWLSAFHQLSIYLDKLKKKEKLVVFIDELPWLDTPKANFIAGLEWFWNSWAINRNVLFIVCGSATSWMMNKLINNKGGLHNRITGRIHLLPFTVGETEAFLKEQKISLTRYQFLQLYMVLGGIPHYLKEVKKGESPAKAIQRICFSRNGLLINEFDNLYRALFANHENHLAVIFALARKSKGLTRSEILQYSKLKDGGTFSKTLEELEWCNFIASYAPFGKAKKETLYRITDEFTMFYIRFMHQKKNVNWQQLSALPAWKTWSGYAFENICIKHVQKIKEALGIAAVYTEESSFVAKGNNRRQGCQIDLLIDRNDGIVNLCEIKFCDKPFVIHKKYAGELRQKREVFQAATRTGKTVFFTFITTFGVAENMYSLEFSENSIDMNTLF